MKQCRSCSAPVIWAVTSRGKPMPVDPEPTKDGNLYLIRGDPPTALSVGDGSKAAKNAKKHDQPRYVSHFATCPHAKQHRDAAKQGELFPQGS